LIISPSMALLPHRTSIWLLLLQRMTLSLPPISPSVLLLLTSSKTRSPKLEWTNGYLLKTVVMMPSDSHSKFLNPRSIRTLKTITILTSVQTAANKGQYSTPNTLI
jgi:hypothetical protein